MATITKSDFIERLSMVSDPDVVRRSVEAALASLGWEARDVFNGSEVIRIGTRMGELLQSELAASSDPAAQAGAEALAPYIDTMRNDVVPHLDPNR